MTKEVLILSLSDGKYRYVNANGLIYYHGISPSGEWRMLALQHVRSTRQIIPFCKITQRLLDRMKKQGLLYYKNGKCQWTVLDLDHGTTRCWGSPAVSRIWFGEE